VYALAAAAVAAALPLSFEVVGCDTDCSAGPDLMQRTWRRHRPDVI